jgi:hypothetical protein
MHIKKMKKIYPAFIFLISVLSLMMLNYSCEKPLFCKNAPTPVVAGGSPVITEGETIVLSVKDEAKTNYRWYGPDNFSHYGPDTRIEKAWLENAGQYRVVAVNDKGCDSSESSFEVTVQMRSIPCTQAVNTGKLNTSNITFSAYGNLSNTTGHYTVNGYSSTADVDIEFGTAAAPKEGYYECVWGNTPYGEHEAKLHTSYGGGNLFSGGGLYVRHLNGKVEVYFCNNSFTGNSWGNTITITGSAHLLCQ